MIADLFVVAADVDETAIERVGVPDFEELRIAAEERDLVGEPDFEPLRRRHEDAAGAVDFDFEGGAEVEALEVFDEVGLLEARDFLEVFEERRRGPDFEVPVFGEWAGDPDGAIPRRGEVVSKPPPCRTKPETKRWKMELS